MNVHVESQLAMEAGCKFYTDPCVGAILCSNADVPRSALLRVTHKNGATLAWNKSGLADFNRRRVSHDEEWTQHLCDRAFHQIAPKARPMPRDSRATPKQAQPQQREPGTECFDPCWVCNKPYNMFIGETLEVTQLK